MSQTLYEQYKDALRRGHVAALRGRLDVALAAYEEAALIAPDRALPHASLGDVFQRLGRVEAAEAAYAVALTRAPGDEAALRGRAELRAGLGNRLDAARDFEALADVLEHAGRLVDACDAARRALELAESRTRRRAVERLTGLLRQQDADPSAAEALRLALLLLEPIRADASDDAAAGDGIDLGAGSAAPDDARGAGAPEDARGTESPEGHTPGLSAAGPPRTSPWTPPLLDPPSALASAEAMLDAHDVAGARHLLLELAAQQRGIGHLDAALDACLALMPIDPADTALQLEIAANQAARGWVEIAAEKVRLLGRLSELDDDAAASEAIAAFAAGQGFADPAPAAPAEGAAPNGA
ncbi:MAG: hypothetical protein HY264_09935 [Chloroflexi bacterium]|nr:hypothetical protein [Chloroflexota bacterium]